MDENSIEFDEGPAQARDRLYVSMRRIGEILFNRHTDEAMGHPEAVVLLTIRIMTRSASDPPAR